MTPLRQRMLDACILRGFSQRTTESYIQATARLSKHFHRSPDLLSCTDVQGYLLELIRDKHLARSSVNQYGCAFRFFYGKVLGRDGRTFQIPLAPAPQKLPEILSREEVARLFSATRMAKARAFLQLSYASGMRLSEVCRLRVCDIDSHPDRMCIKVVQGKGAKDRYIPLEADTLEVLRRWWCVQRPALWVFAAMSDASRPLQCESAQRWYQAARADAAITKRGGIHSLRHAYATHKLEMGYNLYDLQQWLGHEHISSTMRSTCTSRGARRTRRGAAAPGPAERAAQARSGHALIGYGERHQPGRGAEALRPRVPA